ncbi:MAG: zinc finger domain-containing protein [Thermoplasmata archaeon]
MMKEKICASCGRRLAEQKSTVFLCPNCGEVEIGRCAMCRDQSVAYTCPKCNFTGP